MVDAMFAAREASLLSRLEIGLADEGIEVVHALPADATGRGGQDVFARFVTYSPKTNALTRGLAVRQLLGDIARQLDEAPEDSDRLIDAVHLFGGEAWAIGLSLAREAGLPVAIEIWRPGVADRLRRLNIQGIPRVAAMSPDPAIARALSAVGGPWAIVPAPWGVLTDRDSVQPVSPATFAYMMVGTGRSVEAYRAALTGVAAVVRQHPNVFLFCDAQAGRRSELWSHARALGLLDRVTLVEDLEARRDLILQGQALIHPEASGEQRSVLLEAMAAGMVVVASHDPAVSALQAGVTATLVEARDSASWERALRAVIEQRPASLALGASANDYIRKHRTVSDHVRAVLGAYQLLTGQSPTAPERPRAF